MSKSEWPMRLTHSGLVCGLCEFHKQRLIVHRRIGENTYHHYCQHPDSGQYQRQDGAFIGESDHTPKWCPILNDSEAQE